MSSGLPPLLSASTSGAWTVLCSPQDPSANHVRISAGTRSTSITAYAPSQHISSLIRPVWRIYSVVPCARPSKVSHPLLHHARPSRPFPRLRILPSHCAHSGFSRASVTDAQGSISDLRMTGFLFLDCCAQARGPIPPTSGSGTTLPGTCATRTARDARRADAQARRVSHLIPLHLRWPDFGQRTPRMVGRRRVAACASRIGACASRWERAQ